MGYDRAMSPPETFDVLDSSGRPTGRTKNRDEVHRDGDWHRALHLWIVKDGRYVLFQRRSADKDLEPDKLDVSVGGHLSAGETVREALREVEEELGLYVPFEALYPLGTHRAERRYEHATDREFQEVYALRQDQPLTSYTLDRGEVYALYELPLEGALALYRDNTPLAAAGYDAYGRRNDALLGESDIIEAARENVVSALERIRTWLKK